MLHYITKKKNSLLYTTLYLHFILKGDVYQGDKQFTQQYITLQGNKHFALH